MPFPRRFTTAQKEGLAQMGISRQLIHLWDTWQSDVGVRYAKDVALVLGVPLAAVLYPKKPPGEWEKGGAKGGGSPHLTEEAG